MLALAPGLAIVLLVLAFNLFGEWIKGCAQCAGVGYRRSGGCPSGPAVAMHPG